MMSMICQTDPFGLEVSIDAPGGRYRGQVQGYALCERDGEVVVILGVELRLGALTPEEHAEVALRLEEGSPVVMSEIVREEAA